MIGEESIQFFQNIIKFGYHLGSQPYRWNGIRLNKRPYLELSTSRGKLAHYSLSFLFHLAYCTSHVVRSIHVMSAVDVGTAEKIFILSITIFYSIMVAYQMSIASNLHSQPGFTSDYMWYFGETIDYEYERIAGRPFSDAVYLKMRKCHKFVKSVWWLYWFFYAIVLALAILKPSSPHVILSLTWPLHQLSGMRQVLSMLAFVYFFTSYLQNGAMFCWMVFTWFHATVLTLQQLAYAILLSLNSSSS